MKNRWKFQLSPNVPGIVGKGYRMDLIGEEIEGEINTALPGYLKFHGVNKIVIKLGPAPLNEKGYSELLGVGIKQWAKFDLEHYVQADASEKRRLLKECVLDVFAWLEDNFTDANFIKNARQKVPWLSR